LYLHKTIQIGATAHQARTARFGTDPASSALDPLCKARDLATCMWCIEASSPALMPSIHHWLPWPMRFDWQTIWSTDSGEAGMPV
jgi:hypothetical protein